LHTGVAPSQRFPHAPQWSGSEASLTHDGPQRSLPLGQEHLPATQTSGSLQAAPHAEQCSRSLDVSTQLPPQFASPALQFAVHWP
jgi:hypothetical protein